MEYNQSLIIEPGRSEKNYWKDLWRYKELFYILAWRDIKVRYKQTVIGAAWSIVRPLLTTIIFTVIFSRVAQFSHPTAPYILVVFAGMLPWQFFASAMSDASNALVGNSNLISKVYFPRMIIPASTIITSFVDFAISFIILIGMMVIYRFVPDWKIILLPVFIILAFLAAFGTGLFLTALNVKYRDFRFIVPFIVQFGLYITPVGFSSSQFIEKIGSGWKNVFYINPMASVIDGFRWCILGDAMYWPGFFISCGIILFFLWLGIVYFRNTEKSFADSI